MLLRLITSIFLIALFVLPTSLKAQATFEVANSGNWDNPSVWVVIDGSDDDGDGIPDSNDDVVIPEGKVVSLVGDVSMADLVIEFRGSLLFNRYDIDFDRAYIDRAKRTKLYISKPTGNGDWERSSNWYNAGDEVKPEHNVFISATFFEDIVDKFEELVTISQEGALIIGDDGMEWQNDVHLDGWISSDDMDDDKFKIKESMTLSGAGAIDLENDAKVTIDGDYTLTILDGSDISITAKEIESDHKGSLVNYGTLICNAKLDLVSIYQGDGAQLEINEEFVKDGDPDTWDVDQLGNRVKFAIPKNYTLPTPPDGFYNVSLTSSEDHKLKDGLIVLGELRIVGPTDFENGTVSVGGDFLHFDGKIEHKGTVELIGDQEQEMKTFVYDQITFKNLILNKDTDTRVVPTSGILVEETLTMSGGTFEMDDHLFELGTDTENIGQLTYTDGYIWGSMKRWVSNGNPDDLFFPIVSDLEVNTINVNLGTVTSPGSLTAGFNNSAPGTNGLEDGLDVLGSTIHNTFSDGYWELLSADGLTGTQIESISVNTPLFISFPIQQGNRLVFREDATSAFSSGNQTSASVDEANIITTAEGITLSSLNTQIALGSPIDCNVIEGSEIMGDLVTCDFEDANYNVDPLVETSTYLWVAVGGQIEGGEFLFNDATKLEGLDTAIVVDWNPDIQEHVLLFYERTDNCGYGPAHSVEVSIGSDGPEEIYGRDVVGENADSVLYEIENELQYGYRWEVLGGVIVGGQGSGISGDPSYIEGSADTIMVNWGLEGLGEVKVIATDTTIGCPAAPVTLLVEIFTTIDTDADGEWKEGRGDIWENGYEPSSSENARINHAVYLGGKQKIHNLIISSSAVLDLNGHDLEVTGELIIEGGIINSKVDDKKLKMKREKDDQTIHTLSGSPSQPVFANFEIEDPIVINSGTDITFNQDFKLKKDVEVINHGDLTIFGDFLDEESTSWVNAEGRSQDSPTRLEVYGTINDDKKDDEKGILKGTLDAQSNFNEVLFRFDENLELPIPVNNSYHTLTLIGNGVHSAPGNLNITGSLIMTPTDSTEFSLDMDTILFTTNTTSLEQRTTLVDLYELSPGNANFSNIVLDKTGILVLDGNLNIKENGSLLMRRGVIAGDAEDTVKVNNPEPWGLTTTSSNTGINGNAFRLVRGTGNYQFPTGSELDLKLLEMDFVEAPLSAFVVSSFNNGFGDYTISPQQPEYPRPRLLKVSALEYWDVSRLFGDAQPIITLHWNDGEESEISDPISMVVAHYDASAGGWVDLGNGSPNRLNNYVTAQLPLTSFSPITLGTWSEDNALPVELVDFKAIDEGTHIELIWVTASELNNDRFEILRSPTDNIEDFRLIAEVPGGGTTSEISIYRYKDFASLEGVNYYALRQVDYDGQSEVFPPIRIETDKVEASYAFPNPTQDGLVYILQNHGNEVEYHLYDIEGKLYSIYHEKINDVTEQFDLRGLRTGIYYLRIVKNGEVVETVKLMNNKY